MEWSEFAERFSRELAGLDRDTILIVRERDESRHYVQAMREPDRLYAEAVSNNFLDGPLLLTPADEEVLSEVGWRPPTADWSPANWWTELPPPAVPADFARLAGMMVTALRDVQGVRRPADLVYESFHRHGSGLIELTDFGIEPADPGRVSERRSSLNGSGVLRPFGDVPALAAPIAGDGGAGAFPPGDPRAGSRTNGAGGLPGVNGIHGANGAGGPGGLGGLGAAMENGTGGAGGADGLRQAGADSTDHDRPDHDHPDHRHGPRSAPRPSAAVPPRAAVPPARVVPEPYENAELEERLGDAKQRGDHLGCFELLMHSELVLPSAGPMPVEPASDTGPHGPVPKGPGDFVTTRLGEHTYVIVFTSPQAMSRSLGQGAGPYRRVAFGRIAAGWPDPRWSLAVNPGLPSEIHLDSATVARLEEMRRTAEQAATVDAVVTPAPRPGGGPPPAAPPIGVPGPTATETLVDTATGTAPGTAPGTATDDRTGPVTSAAGDRGIRLPHGARLWWHRDGGAVAPVAVYDAVRREWEPVSVGKRARRSR